jgi:hypothetical protein
VLIEWKVARDEPYLIAVLLNQTLERWMYCDITRTLTQGR